MSQTKQTHIIHQKKVLLSQWVHWFAKNSFLCLEHIFNSLKLMFSFIVMWLIIRHQQTCYEVLHESLGSFR